MRTTHTHCGPLFPVHSLSLLHSRIHSHSHSLSHFETVRTKLKRTKTSQIEGLKGSTRFLRFIRVEPYHFQVRNPSKTHGIRTPFLSHYSCGSDYERFSRLQACRKLWDTPTKLEEEESKDLDVRNPSFSNYSQTFKPLSFCEF